MIDLVYSLKFTPKERNGWHGDDAPLSSGVLSAVYAHQSF